MTVNSPAPGTPQTATKAVYGAIAGFVFAFLTALYATLQGRTDLDNAKPLDWFIIILGALVTAGTVGGLVFQTKNRAL